MRSTSIVPGSRTSGAIPIWTALVIAAVVCLAAVIVFQVMEYLFYDQPPSVWSGAGPSAAPQTITKPSSETAAQTNVTPEQVPPAPSTEGMTNAVTEPLTAGAGETNVIPETAPPGPPTYDITNAITEALSESAGETNVMPEKVLPVPSTDAIANAGTEEKPPEPPTAPETKAVE